MEVSLDADRIASIDLVNLSESTKAAFPLMKPALESLAAQIYQSQSLENITYPDDQKYTSQLLLSSIKEVAMEQGLCTKQSLIQYSILPALPSIWQHLHRSAFARSPLGESATVPIFGPSGRQERLNCWEKNLL